MEIIRELKLHLKDEQKKNKLLHEALVEQNEIITNLVEKIRELGDFDNTEKICENCIYLEECKSQLPADKCEHFKMIPPVK